MAVIIEDLFSRVLENVNQSDDIIIISGYFSPDVLRKIAETGKPVKFYYGMYNTNSITSFQLNALKTLELDFGNFNAHIVYDYHVHTKCYIFKANMRIINILVGSANVSSNGLMCGKNSEMLVDIVDQTCWDFLNSYSEEINAASVPINSPLIVVSERTAVDNHKVIRKHERLFSGNPFVDNIPLYSFDQRNRKFVPKSSGLNWGLQRGHHAIDATFAEAYIPIKAFDIDKYPLIIPSLGEVGTGNGGRNTRRLSPVMVVWDDGTEMEMSFQGTGPQRPTNAAHTPGTPFRQYPKQLTSNEGGTQLGRYLRTRLGVEGRQLITYSDLKRYGRDYITLSLVGPGYYEADFRRI